MCQKKKDLVDIKKMKDEGRNRAREHGMIEPVVVAIGRGGNILR